jgi:iron complex transport system substrate-binding protein
MAPADARRAASGPLASGPPASGSLAAGRRLGRGRPLVGVHRALVALLLGPLALLAACAGSSGSSGSTGTASAARPHRIVSLSPTATEMLYAVGAGSQVVAVDDQSNYPAQAPRTKLSGFQPNTEAVAGYQPDLVVYSNDANGLAGGLARLKLPALRLPAAASLDDTYAQLTQVGAATGHPAEAADAVRGTKARVAAAVASVPAPATRPRVYHELDTTYYSVTSSTFIGSLYRLFGLVNIADQAPKLAGGYPQLSAEFVAAARPDVVVLADGTCCAQSAQTFAARPAFGALPAVAAHRVVVVNGDIASRWGPRVADFAEAVAAALKNTR